MTLPKARLKHHTQQCCFALFNRHLGLIDFHPWRIRHPRPPRANSALFELSWVEMVAWMEQQANTIISESMDEALQPEARLHREVVVAHKWNTGWAVGSLSENPLSPAERQHKLTHNVQFPDGEFAVRLVSATQITRMPESNVASQLPVNSWCAWAVV